MHPALPLLLASTALADAPPIQSHVLPDGLEILVAEDHSLPLFTVEIAVKNGSMTEPPEYNGLSHLYEHMFFKANKVIPNQTAYLARLRELGMEFNGTTNTERVNYFFTTTTDHFDDSMVFMRDAITSPLFEPEELKRERRVVVGEIDRNDANPYYHFFHDVDQQVWGKYASRKDPLGNRETVLGLPKDLIDIPDDKLPPATVKKAVEQIRTKMETIHHRYYVPNNSALIVTGDVKAEQVFALSEKLYAGWRRAPDPFKKFPLPKVPPIAKSSVVLVEQPVETVTGELTWHGPSTVGPSAALTYPADVLGFATDEPSSRLQKDLVDSGACVRAGFHWSTQMNVGPISFNFEAVPERVDDCVKAVLAELPKMAQPDYLSAEERENAAHAAEVEQALSRETPSGYAHAISFWWTSAGLDYYRGYVANLRKATPADIAKYMETYVLGKPFVFGVMLSPEIEKEKKLDQAHFEELAGLKAGTTSAARGASR